jgi:hypothetical protein
MIYVSAFIILLVSSALFVGVMVFGFNLFRALCSQEEVVPPATPRAYTANTDSENLSVVRRLTAEYGKRIGADGSYCDFVAAREFCAAAEARAAQEGGEYWGEGSY